MSTATFRELDGDINVGDSSLDHWYSEIRDTPLNELKDGDLARCCRQKLFLEHVVPVVILRLTANPMAGDIYDGELLAAMQTVGKKYWQVHSEQARQLRDTINQTNLLECDEETAKKILELGSELC